MTKKILSLLLIVFLSLNLFGCATGRDAGGLIGGLIGAGVGAVTSKHNPILGAIVGGTLGTIAGSIVGDYADRQEQSRQEVLRELRYRNYYGKKIQIRESIADPAVVRPGERVSLRTSYYVLSPLPDEKMRVLESREIIFNGESIMRPLVREITRYQGLTSSTLSLPIPREALEGEYTVITTVDNGSVRERSISRFYIRQI